MRLRFLFRGKTTGFPGKASLIQQKVMPSARSKTRLTQAILAVPPKSLKEMMADCTTKTIGEFPFEGQLSRNMGGIFIQLFELTSKGPLTTHGQVAALTLAIRNFRFLQCAADNIFDGYYEVGMTVLRNVYENNLLATYLSRNPEKSKEWLSGRYFDQKFLRNAVGQSNSIYGVLSEVYAHPGSVRSVILLFEKIEKRTLTLRLYPEFDSRKCSIAIQFLLMMNWHSILEFQYAFRETLWKNETWKTNFTTWNEIIVKYIEEKVIKKSDLKFEFKNKLPT